MDALLGLLGLLGIVVGVIFLIIKIVKKNPVKPAFVVIGISFLLVVVGLAMPSSSDERAARRLEESNQSYQEGIEMYKSGSIAAAQDKLSKVIQDDPNYADAQEKINLIGSSKK